MNLQESDKEIKGDGHMFFFKDICSNPFIEKAFYLV